MGQTEMQNLLKQIEADKDIYRENKKYVPRLVVYLQAKNSDEKTILKWLYNFSRFAKCIKPNTDFKDLTREDLEQAVAKITTSDYADWTKATVLVFVKAFYKHFYGEDYFYPKQIAWLKLSRPRSKLMPTDMLTEEDIKRMLIAAKDFRDRAIIALLFDSGIRVGELLGMRRRDVVIEQDPSIIAVNGKTGIRQVPITFSVPYIAQYLNSKPDMKGSDPLFTLTKKGVSSAYTYDAVRMMLKRTAQEAKIGKKVWNHLFRHSRATFYSNTLTDRQLEMVFGWRPGSRMPATYSHLSTKDIENAVLVATGYKKKQDDKKSVLLTKSCFKCGVQNTADSIYCTKCGSLLDIENAVDANTQKENFREWTAAAFKDKKFFEESIHNYLMEERKRKRRENK